MATTTNYGWTTPDDTALVKDGAAAIRTLGSSVDSTTKALNPSTTLGDIAYSSATANTNTRLPIGTSGNVLTVAGGVPTWAAAASGSMTLLSTTTFSGTEVTISSISQNYTDLLILIDDWTVGSGGRMQIGLNGNYNQTPWAMVFSGAAAQNTEGLFWSQGEEPRACASLLIRQYKNTSIRKSLTGSFARGSSLNVGGVIGGLWNSTSALSSIKIRDSWANQTMTAGTCRIIGVN